MTCTVAYNSLLLSQVVGPPGTGKTDVAVQIIANLYHNFPDQRTLIVTHSNQASRLVAEVFEMTSCFSWLFFYPSFAFLALPAPPSLSLSLSLYLYLSIYLYLSLILSSCSLFPSSLPPPLSLSSFLSLSPSPFLPPSLFFSRK